MQQRSRTRGRKGGPEVECSRRRVVVLASWLFAGGMLLSASFAHTGAQLLHRQSPANQQGLLPSPPLTTMDGIPPFYDYGAYLFFNPDLASLTQPEAEQHYLAAGRAEGRLARRIPLYVTYKTYYGLCNQLFHHIEGISFARGFLPHANTTVVTRDAWARQSFSDRVAQYEEKPVESLLDWPRVVAYLRHTLGMTLTKYADTASCVQVRLWSKPSHDLTAMTGRLQFKPPQAAAATAGLIGNLTRPALRSNPEAQPCVHVDLGNPGLANFLLNRPPGWSAPAARGVCFFAPVVEQVAGTIIKALEAAGHSSYLSAHLRIEQDWIAARHIKGGEEEMLQAYFQVMQQAGFQSTSTIYAASGVFDYKNSTEVAQLKARFRAAGVCGEMYHKGELVPLSQLAELNPEQLALVDLLVVSRGQAMVGHSLSTFSVFAREYRALVLGLPKSTFFSVVDDARAHLAFAPPYPE